MFWFSGQQWRLIGFVNEWVKIVTKQIQTFLSDLQLSSPGNFAIVYFISFISFRMESWLPMSVTLMTLWDRVHLTFTPPPITLWTLSPPHRSMPSLICDVMTIWLTHQSDILHSMSPWHFFTLVASSVACSCTDKT